MIVELTFNVWSRKQIAAGKKSCTSRNRAHGVAGDTFCVGQKMFMIHSVLAMRLRRVAEEFWKPEGAESKDDFRHQWLKIYGLNGFDPDRIVYVHFFEEMDEILPGCEMPAGHAVVMSPVTEAAGRALVRAKGAGTDER